MGPSDVEVSSVGKNKRQEKQKIQEKQKTGIVIDGIVARVYIGVNATALKGATSAN
jgi:hypothetical protein